MTPDQPGAPDLGAAEDYEGEGKEVLSDDDTTITWTIPTQTQAGNDEDGDPVVGGIFFPTAADDADGSNGNYRGNPSQRLHAGGTVKMSPRKFVSTV